MTVMVAVERVGVTLATTSLNRSLSDTRVDFDEPWAQEGAKPPDHETEPVATPAVAAATVERDAA